MSKETPSGTERGKEAYSRREIQVMQGLVDNLRERQFDTVYGIGPKGVSVIKKSLDERFSATGDKGGLPRAVFRAAGLLDLSRLPRYCQEQPNDLEVFIIGLSIKGYSRGRIGKRLEINQYKIEGYKREICRKFGVKNFYQVAALCAIRL
ncbi:helix-turn-helix transcriptional regulator [Candidatus Curtissbacteria bacterium]|nr:helix-turn-helix transcriptional regulator [Candidatus Curtissbacteria bacterium]